MHVLSLVDSIIKISYLLLSSVDSKILPPFSNKNILKSHFNAHCKVIDLKKKKSLIKEEKKVTKIKWEKMKQRVFKFKNVF